MASLRQAMPRDRVQWEASGSSSPKTCCWGAVDFPSQPVCPAEHSTAGESGAQLPSATEGSHPSRGWAFFSGLEALPSQGWEVS